MQIDSVISTSRLYYLLKRDFLGVGNLNKVLITSGAAAAVIIFVAVINSYGYPRPNHFYSSIFPSFLFWGGVIVTSSSFKELHRKETVQNYLMLPASTFEKFLSRLLLSTIGYALLAVAGMTLISILGEGINTILFKRHNVYFNPLDGEVWRLAANYIVVQSLFFLGAVYFKRNNFLKTLITIFLFIVVVAIIFLFLLRIFFADFYGNILSRPGDISLYINTDRVLLVKKILRIIYWVVLAPLFWTISYIRIKGIESKDAV